MPATIREKWEKRVRPMHAAETRYLEKSPSMDAMSRTRGPYLVSLFKKLADDCGMHKTSENLRLYQVWIHIVLIVYYIGEPNLFKALLGNDEGDAIDQTDLWDSLVAYIKGETDGYNDVILSRLKVYALTRHTSRRWVNHNDGTHLVWQPPMC